MDDRITLREVKDSDLLTLFEQQLDPEANVMAAFTSRNPADYAAFQDHWRKIRSNNKVTNRIVLSGEQVAGYVASFTDDEFGKPEVTYWIGKEYWRRGIATEALKQFLDHEVKVRPIYARAASDNLGSIKVLKKCHFKVTGTNEAFAEARGKKIEEFILKLE
ncbi:MAG TPA: GNAT family N-acetyltransferase [Nitrososphaerales archaeon]|nr:GNAT family N-acetyltransferase [Nitrososphaerales archaeon]